MDANRIMARAFTAAAQPALDPAQFDTRKLALDLAALADQGVVLPLREFARLTKRAEQAAAAETLLPALFRHLAACPDLEQRLLTNPYVTGEKTASARARYLAVRLQPTFGLTKSACEQRCLRAALRGLPEPDLKSGFEKTASAEARVLADDYGLYKLAALERFAGAGGDFLLTAKLAVLQNLVS